MLSPDHSRALNYRNNAGIAFRRGKAASDLRAGHWQHLHFDQLAEITADEAEQMLLIDQWTKSWLWQKPELLEELLRKRGLAWR